MNDKTPESFVRPGHQKPLTHAERQALIRMPITRGILAERHYGRSTTWSGGGSDGTWRACTPGGRQRAKIGGLS